MKRLVCLSQLMARLEPGYRGKTSGIISRAKSLQEGQRLKFPLVQT